MSRHFEEGCEFIDRNLRGQRNTLVHCHAGISRSVAIVVAYFVKSGWTVDQALGHVRTKRPRANPNSSFMSQLRMYDENLRKNTASLVKSQSTN